MCQGEGRRVQRGAKGETQARETNQPFGGDCKTVAGRAGRLPYLSRTQVENSVRCLSKHRIHPGLRKIQAPSGTRIPLVSSDLSPAVPAAPSYINSTTTTFSNCMKLNFEERRPHQHTQGTQHISF